MKLRSKWQTAWLAVPLIVLVWAQGCAPAATPIPATATVAPATATAVPPTATAAAPSGAALDGHWEGAVDVAGQNIITRVDWKSQGGQLVGTVDFPQQNASGLPLDKVSQQGNKVHFEVLPAPRTAVFDGELQGTDNMTGSFLQSGISGTFHLERKQVQASEPVPYKEEEVKFQNGDITLAGTLTLPPTAGPYPALVLITGSGTQNRDEEVFGFKVFRVLADYLTRQGIAVLRYDDRGVGGSTAGIPEDTSETYAGDVLAAVQFLMGRPDIDAKQIGLLGHSEGGIIAPMVAVRTTDVAFIILMSGPGEPGRLLLPRQSELIYQASGATQAELDKQLALQKLGIDAALTGQGQGEFEAAVRKEYQDAAAAMTDEERKAVGDVNQWVEQMVQAQVQAMSSAWMKYFLAYDPALTLEKVTVPVLALFGGLDLQVPAEENRVAIMAALDRGGNKDHTAKVIPDANHLYQSAKTGSPTEYATLKPEFTPGFLDALGSWILAHVHLAGK